MTVNQKLHIAIIMLASSSIILDYSNNNIYKGCVNTQYGFITISLTFSAITASSISSRSSISPSQSCEYRPTAGLFLMKQSLNSCSRHLWGSLLNFWLKFSALFVSSDRRDVICLHLWLTLLMIFTVFMVLPLLSQRLRTCRSPILTSTPINFN